MRFLLSLLAALTLASALAHTEVTGITPAAGARVVAPKTVTLTFGEPVNLRFSTFKVVPLPAGADAAQTAAAALARKDDAKLRADTAPVLTGMAARVTLPLHSGLKPGTYLILWRLLSEDGHPVTGHSTFQVR
ncbi:copper resistance protein CopC [Deinococcus phoenicis]|uniref:Copper resistance protein CopC n=1 Tax=Deinococcus phoenicis TaxID=1476583 RepID=A0A016QP68_9DEIO|nr:copper resistance CopC family protein [Deinococcus phoenicis]EYB67672.1 copper resistance protein CopC [Deinococcus phoenicis]